jgi:hypothetical protein
MAWAKNGSTTLSSTGDTITVSDMTASKTMMFLQHDIGDTGDENHQYRFDNNANTDYAYRYSWVGTNDATASSQTLLTFADTNTQQDGFTVMYVVNIDGEEKLVIGFLAQEYGANSGTAPARCEMVGKCDTTTNSGQFTRIDALQQSTGGWLSGSNLSALGSELTPASAIAPETNSIFIETDTAKRYWFSGSEWIDPTIPIYGLFGGGGTPTVVNTIDYITIATAGNATDFGDLTQSRNSVGATDDNSRGVWAGGYNSGAQNTIDYVTIGTAGNATDFGDLTESRYPLGGASNNVRGVFGGGYNAGFKNTIDYITIATAGNATDFGDLTVSRDHLDAVDDSSRAVWGGGESPPTNTMDYVTIATTGNATDFGDLTVARYYASGLSSDTRGVFAGGHNGTNTLNTIDYITIQTTGNATDFGDLSIAKHQMAGVSNLSRGCYSGGTNYYVDIEYITISTTGNSTDFGDLTQGRNTPAGVDGS